MLDDTTAIWIHLLSRNQPSGRSLNHVLNTRGVGKGLDDESLDPAIKATGLVIFLHPYYGVDSQHSKRKQRSASGTVVSHLTGRSPILCDSESIYNAATRPFLCLLSRAPPTATSRLAS